jgi:hypothetical protein
VLCLSCTEEFGLLYKQFFVNDLETLFAEVSCIAFEALLPLDSISQGVQAFAIFGRQTFRFAPIAI